MIKGGDAASFLGGRGDNQIILHSIVRIHKMGGPAVERFAVF